VEAIQAIDERVDLRVRIAVAADESSRRVNVALTLRGFPPAELDDLIVLR